MKGILTVCILLLGGFRSALCQTPESPNQIEYDFYKNKFIKSVSAMKHNEWVQVTVKNINPYIYKINVANKDSTTPAGTPPSILKDLFDFDKLVKIASNLVSSGSVPTASASSVDNTSGKVKPNKQQEEQKRAEALQQCFNQQQTMENATIKYAKNIVALKTEVTQKLNEQAIPLRLKLLWRIDVAQEPAKKWLAAPQTADVNKIDENLKDVFEHATEYQKDFTEAYVNYRKKITGCLVDFPKEKKLRAVDSLIKLFEQEQRTVLADFAPTLGGKLNTLKDELMNLKSENFSYTSVPLQMRQPMKDITITFEPVGTANTGLSSYSLTIPLQLKKQPFAGFSSGFFYSGLTGDPYIVRDSVALLKRTGRTVFDSSAHYYRLSSENQGSGEWGVAALIHYGENICSSRTVHWHVSTGIGLTIQNKPQPRGLLGGGLAFGEKNKLVITIGGIIGYVQQLSEAYNADSSRILYAAPSSFTKSKLKGSIFFSITYNFLNL